MNSLLRSLSTDVFDERRVRFDDDADRVTVKDNFVRDDLSDEE